MSEPPRKWKFTRQELYEQVWSQPMKDLAARFGMSDVAIAKKCRAANVPVPERGHWAKKKANRPTQQRPLPLRFPGASDNVTFGKEGHYGERNWRQELLDEAIPEVAAFSEDLVSVAKRAKEIVGRVRPSSNLDKADWLIAKILAHDDERRERFLKWHWSSDTPKYESGTERRRLLILDALFLALRRVGCAPSMSTSKYTVDSPEGRHVSIRVGNQTVSLQIERDDTKKKPRSPATGSDPLRLSIGSTSQLAHHRAWNDHPGDRLEDHLSEISVAILVAAEEAYRAAQVWYRQNLIERKQEIEKELVKEREAADRMAREELERQHKERTKRLLEQAAELREADRIRAYVDTVRTRSAGASENLDRWSRWALAEADRIDPTKNGIMLAAINELQSASSTSSDTLE